MHVGSASLFLRPSVSRSCRERRRRPSRARLRQFQRARCLAQRHRRNLRDDQEQPEPDRLSTIGLVARMSEATFGTDDPQSPRISLRSSALRASFAIQTHHICARPTNAANMSRACRTVVAFGRPCEACLGARPRRVWAKPCRGMTVKKIVIALGATLAFATAANAADLPRRQPVPVYPAEQAPIGKMPIGKSPVGKAPIGKAPGPFAARY